MNCIYCLFDPRDPQQIPMYVGKGNEKRAISHWKKFLLKGRGQNKLQGTWFEKLQNEGIEPSWKFLEENVENWQEREKYWISYWRKRNIDLCNIWEGGNAPTTNDSRLGGETAARLGRSGFITMWDNRREEMLEVQKENKKKLWESKSEEMFAIVSKAGKEAARQGKSGLMTAWKKQPEKMRDNARKNGILGGEAAKEFFKKNKDFAKSNGYLAAHAHWHVNRNKLNPECQFCRPDFFDIWEGQAVA